MDATLNAINESQWILCLIQVTILMLVSWILGRISLRKFPDITASIGVVALAVSAGLIVLTWAGVPRPFQLSVPTTETVTIQAVVDAEHSSAKSFESKVEPQPSLPSWFGKLSGMLNWSATSMQESGASESAAQRDYPIHVATSLLLTLFGGLVGIARVLHSSKTILDLARSSTPVEDSNIRAEVLRILDRLPTGRQHSDIPVRQFSGTGSPFVSWLTGNKIFVPESFPDWSAAEQSVSLAHEIGHLQRRDHYCRLITQLTFCLTWLHPMAWILHRQTVLAQELAADQVAAQATRNPSAYRRGLSRLALRFDAECRQPSAIGVSVSSSLIRRITMLKGITHRLPRSRFVNRCITWSAFIACTLIGCWSVSGQTTTQEKQPDSKVVTASHTAPVAMFSQPVTAPWEVVGNQPGYLKVDVSRVLSHPYANLYRPMITSTLNSALRSTTNEAPTLKQFGLSLDEITQLQGGFYVSYSYNPEEPDGQRSSLSLGMNASVEVEAANPVDWPGLINALDFEKYHKYVATASPTLAEVDLEVVREAWMKSAQKSHTHVFDGDSLQASKVKLELPTETKKAVWEAVSGGVVTAVYDISHVGDIPEDYQEQDGLNQANLEMTLATETAAWGVDFSQDYKTFQVRFVAVPNEGVSTDELIEKFEAFKVAFADHTADEAFAQQLLENLKKATVTIVDSQQSNGETTKSYMLVEGECTIDFFKLMKNAKQD
jgi:beta-lactamase regulating signal transducer with metallopeptidase domain